MGIVSLSRSRPRAAAPAQTLSREWLTVIALIVGILGLTALPYLYGYAVAGTDRVFMGIVLNVPDTGQYFSWARESAHAFLIENKLTPERGDPMYFNLFWWGVGQLALLTGLGVAEATQVVRLLAGALYIGAIYWLVALVARNRLERWTAFLVASLGGGLGWLLVLGKQVTGSLAAPLDLYITEANTFLTVMAFPHQAMAGALQVLGLGLAAVAFERRSSRLAALSGLLVLALGVQHGYDLLIVYTVVGGLGLALALRDGGWIRTIVLGALVCGPSMPAAAYVALLTRESPIWRGVLAQYGNAGVYTPTPPHLLVLMGLPLLLVLGGLPLLVTRRQQIRAWFQRASPPELLVWVWLIVGFLLLYIPTDFQIKMLACWQVPVAIIATRLLLDHVRPRLARLRPLARMRLGPILAVIFVLAVLPVNIYLLSWRMVDLGRRDYPYFLAHDEVSAMRWLESNTPSSDVVLSSLTIGQYVPSVSGNTAVLAHWAQTLDFYGKREQVSRFFDPAAPDAERAAILGSYDIRYVVHGPAERALGAFDPDGSPYLERVYSGTNVSVYRVRLAALRGSAA
jgi:hypothetical protein